MLPKFTFRLVSQDIDRELARIESAGGITARVVNDAKNEGFEYWPAVNSGRKGFGAKNGRLLKFVGGRDGATVYARRVRATPGQRFREAAVPTITSRASAILSQVRTFSRRNVVAVINEIARIASDEIKTRSPRRSGKLQQSYRVEEAE